MMTHLKEIIAAQYEAALAMLNECIVKCPEEHWDGLIAKYPFWQVAYHVLCCVDCDLEVSEEAFKPRADLHPAGMADLNDEYPSRRFTKEELVRYTAICLEKLQTKVAAETQATLEAPCGYSRRSFSHAELYLFSMRHVQHHTGQLSAFLRRVGVQTGWVWHGWK